jgi:hypothetical protein
MSTGKGQELYQKCLLPTKSSIRPLQIATSSDSEGVTISLRPFETKAAPHYTALSYAWGTPVPLDDVPSADATVVDPRSIQCSGYEISATNGEIYEYNLCGEYEDITFGMKSSLATVAPDRALYA